MLPRVFIESSLIAGVSISATLLRRPDVTIYMLYVCMRASVISLISLRYYIIRDEIKFYFFFSFFFSVSNK